MLELLVAVSGSCPGDVCRRFGFNQFHQIRHMLNALPAERFTPCSRVKNVKIDKTAQSIVARYRNRREAKKITESVCRTALLDEECFPPDWSAIQRYVGEPEKNTALRVNRYMN